jgi:hypothetical protein
MALLLASYLVWLVYLNRNISEKCVPFDKEFRRINRWEHERWEKIERVKTCAKEGAEIAYQNRSFEKVLGEERKFWFWFIGKVTWRGYSNRLVLLGTLGYGAWLIWRGDWSNGVFVPLLMYATKVSESVWHIGHIEHQINWNMPAIRTAMLTLTVPPDGPGPFTFTRVGPGPGEVPLYKTSYNGVEPRFAAAWDPFSDGKSSIRAGYGIYHDRVFGQLISQLRGDPPYQMLETLPCGGFFATPPQLQACTLAAQSPPTTFQSSPEIGSCQLGQFCSPILPYLIDPNLKTPYTQTWNLGIQHELQSGLLFEVNYVGSKGTHLLRLVDGNPPQPELVSALEAFCVPSNPQNVFGCTQQTLQFSNLWLGADELNPATGLPLLPFNAVNNNAFLEAELYKSIATSTYNALQVNVTKRLSHGLAVQAAYTYSHAIDNASDPLVPAAGNQAFPRNSLNLAAERGNSDFDVRQRLVLNYTWQLPVGNGAGRPNEGTAGWLLANWSVSGVSTFSGGLPYDIFTNVDTEHTGQAARAFYNPMAVAPPSNNPRTQTGPSLAYFSDPAFGFPGNLGRNVFRGPGINNTDVVISKRVGIRERLKLDLRFEFYNLFNRVQFNQPDNFTFDAANFGHSTSEIVRPDGTTGARQIQLGLKLSF